jgi:hypothetical protein
MLTARLADHAPSRDGRTMGIASFVLTRRLLGILCSCFITRMLVVPAMPPETPAIVMRHFFDSYSFGILEEGRP